MSWAATSGLVPVGVQHGRGRFMRPKRASFLGQTPRADFDHASWPPAAPSLQHQESRFFKGVLRGKVALRMKRTRHQLAPVVPVQEILALCCRSSVPPLVFHKVLLGTQPVVQRHPAGASSFGKTRQQGLFLGQGHVLALASAIRLRLQRLDAVVIIGHLCTVHCARATHPSPLEWPVKGSCSRVRAPSGRGYAVGMASFI